MVASRIPASGYHDDFSHENIAIDMEGVMNGTIADIPLKKNDVIYVPSINELKEEETISIYGEVANPGTFLYSRNMSIKDLIVHDSQRS